LGVHDGVNSSTPITVTLIGATYIRVALRGKNTKSSTLLRNLNTGCLPYEQIRQKQLVVKEVFHWQWLLSGLDAED